MPIGGANGIGWNENSPSDSDGAGLGDDHFRSVKTTVRSGLDSEHNWPSAGGDNVGYHRFGSARPYYGLQSAVSSSGSDGRLMLTSDTSRLFAVGSGGTVLLGGALSVLYGGGSVAEFPQRHYWAIEVGTQSSGPEAYAQITIPNSGFSGAPRVLLTSDVTAGLRPVFACVDAVTGTTFDIYTFDRSGSSALNVTVNWMSFGSRVL